MNVEVRLSNEQPFKKVNNTPIALKAFCIPGSEMLCSDNESGQFLLQVISFEKYSIVFAVLQPKKDVLVSISSVDDLVFSHMSLKGNFSYLSSEKRIEITEGKVNVFSSSNLNASLTLSGNSEYVSLILVYPKDFVEQQLAYYPSIEKFKKDVINKKASELSSVATYISAKMFDCVHTLLHSPYSETTQRFHIVIIKNLLRLVLQEITRANHNDSKYSLEYLESIHAAKDFIDNNLLHHDTINQIARKVGLNELKLKRGFKEVFGKGLYGYRKQERLKIAKATLEQTIKPIKEIAKSTGYKNTNNFSIAIKKVFGLSPAQLRKKFKS